MKLESSTLQSTLSFETYAGVKYNNLKFVAILDAGTVSTLGQDPLGLHLQNLPYLQDPKPESHTDYSYVLFLDAEGKKTYLGIPWIREGSIVNKGQPNYLMTIIAPTPEQLSSLRSMAIASGIENFTIKAI